MIIITIIIQGLNEQIQKSKEGQTIAATNITDNLKTIIKQQKLWNSNGKKIYSMDISTDNPVRLDTERRGNG